jgi:hypothetical protein
VPASRLLLYLQAHAYFKGVDFEALLRREIAMKPEWIPDIKGDHDNSMFDPKTRQMVLTPASAHFPPTLPFRAGRFCRSFWGFGFRRQKR